MGGTKALFVPSSCVFARAACCRGRPLAADEPVGGRGEKGCWGEGGETARLTVACGS